MKKYIFTIVLILVIVFHLLNIFQWMQNETWIHTKDVSCHLLNMSDAFRFLESGDVNRLIWIDEYYPPFFYWIGLLYFKISFNYYGAVFFVPACFFVILILSVYGIGKELFDKQTALFAAIICSFFPLNYIGSITYNLELATEAMVCLTIYLLIKNRKLADFWYSVAIGLLLIIDGLLRPMTLLYLLCPAVFLIHNTFKNTKPQKRQVINLLLIMFIAAVGLFAYYHRMDPVNDIIVRLNTENAVSSENIISLEHLLYYIRTLPRQISLFNTMLLAGCVLIFFKAHNFSCKVVLSWIILPVVILTFFMKLKNYEYANGYLPALAFIIAAGLSRINSRLIRKYAMVLVLIVNMCGYFKTF